MKKKTVMIASVIIGLAGIGALVWWLLTNNDEIGDVEFWDVVSDCSDSIAIVYRWDEWSQQWVQVTHGEMMVWGRSYSIKAVQECTIIYGERQYDLSEGWNDIVFESP